MKKAERKAIIAAYNPDDDECHYHGKPMVSMGYATCYATIGGKRTTTTLHRILYAEFNKVTLESLTGRVIMHTCDNAWCINLNHLKKGSYMDNMQDMLSKDRVRFWVKDN